MKKFTFRLLSLALAVMLAAALTVFSVSAADDDTSNAADDAAVSVVDDNAQDAADDDAAASAVDDDAVSTADDDAQSSAASDDAQDDAQTATQAAQDDATDAADDSLEGTGDYVCTLYQTSAETGNTSSVGYNDMTGYDGKYVAVFSGVEEGYYTAVVAKSGEEVAQMYVYACGNVTVTYESDTDSVYVSSDGVDSTAVYYATLTNNSDGTTYTIDLSAFPSQEYVYVGLFQRVAAGTYNLSVTDKNGAEQKSTTMLVEEQMGTFIEVSYNSSTGNLNAQVVGGSSSDDEDADVVYNCEIINNSTGESKSDDMGLLGNDGTIYVAGFSDVTPGTYTIYVGDVNSGILQEAEYTLSGSENAYVLVYYNPSTAVITVNDGKGNVQGLSTTKSDGSKSATKTAGTAAAGAGSSTSDTAKSTNGNAVKTGVSIAVIAVVVVALGGVGFFIFKRKNR